MPVINGLLLSDGALVEVAVGLSFSSSKNARAALRPIPPPVNTRALLDTGAEMTCIDLSLVPILGLPLGGATLANVPSQGGLTFTPVHDVSLTVLHPSGKAPDNLMFRDLSVLELPIGARGYQVLIGRDVLAKCRFLFDGPGNRFTLSY